MSEFQRVCDVYQGYDFKPDRQTTIGYITAFNVAGTDLAADQSNRNPLDLSEHIAAVVVLSQVIWLEGAREGLIFSGQVSVANKQVIAAFYFDAAANLDVTFAFDVYEFDSSAKKYFNGFSSGGATIKGTLMRNGVDISLSVSSDPSTQVQSPLNFSASIGIAAPPVNESLTVATDASTSITKPWGHSGS
jgi:hypothetical protein